MDLLTPSSFVASITSLLSNPNPLITQYALILFNEKLQQHAADAQLPSSSSSSSLSQKKKRSSVAVVSQPEVVLLFVKMVPSLTAVLTSSLSSSTSSITNTTTINKQTALLSLELLVRHFSHLCVNDFIPVLPTIIDCISSLLKFKQGPSSPLQHSVMQFPNRHFHHCLNSFLSSTTLFSQS
eukprot:c4732_g1_i2.p2 GENE.c4732_g1_i2~~c4732_g1_i2.p2  ORF type:complete len:182 (-),score=10.77 c4732_g1_i2:1138-1683(-)